MRCDRFREAASARLDGEPIGMSASALDHHLSTCVDCAGWDAAATRLTRQARLGTAAVPDLVETITADVVLPAGRVLRRRMLLRIALFVAGAVQLLIAVPALAGDSIGMVMSAHATHEAAAWNLAIAVAFLATASRPRRAAGLIPLLATFVVVLGALSVRDVAAGVVSPGRLSTHADALVGLVLVLLLDRAERAVPRGRSHAAEDGSAQNHDRRGVRGVA